MEQLIKDILLKKELKNLDYKIVQSELKKYFKKNEKIFLSLTKNSYNKRSSNYKITIKDVRKKLREIYGVFIEEKYSKKEELLSKITAKNKDKILREILSLHKSSKERIPYYKKIYKKIFEITKKPESILDLACGLNPLSYEWLGCKPRYVASDISSKDLSFIQTFFNKIKIKGETERIDLTENIDYIQKKKFDICFLFKALDSIEARNRHASKKIIEKINSDWIVVSFSKVSLGGGKEIKKSKRNWFVNFLKKNNYHYEEFEIPNEYFIVVKKTIRQEKT
ncbi:MAG: hypothetical protein KKF89_03040 [Nanoarchaeota archaeon]|nr:hypothetical protein [Nanoarchaeota archaeon]MBU1854670.1 hypothetical protein [Nanoarchaeota archaeon]